MFLDKVERIQVRIENIFAGILSGFIALMMIFTTTDVCLRYIFNRPLAGVYVLCEMMMAGTVYLAIAYVQQKKGHVRVDVLYANFRRVTKAWSNIIGSVLLGIPLCWVILMQGSLPDLRAMLALGLVGGGLVWLGHAIFVRASYRFVEEL